MAAGKNYHSEYKELKDGVYTIAEGDKNWESIKVAFMNAYLTKNGFNKENAVFFDDTLGNVLKAQKDGIKSLWVQHKTGYYVFLT